MRSRLVIHPESRCAAVTRIEADYARPRPDALALRYVVMGRIDDVLMPPRVASARTDELWKHTCFEAFVWPGSRAAYYELNVAPSTHWAAYHFDAYRVGMRAADEIGPPRIEIEAGADRYELNAHFTLPGDRPWRVKMTAVIEEKSGEKSYWAFAHPPGRPDFHHASGYGFAVHFPEQA